MYTFKGYISEMYKSLSASELLKPGREGRGENLIRKIQDSDPFLLHAGGTVVIKKNDQQLADIKKALDTADNKTLNNMVFIGADNKEYKLKDFAKSPEFGGKGKGSGTRAEDASLTDLKNKLQDILEKETVPFIYVQIGRKTEKVSAVESTPGTPKSDFHMMDEEGNEVFWISHKQGRTAKDFQQYGGMVEIQREKEVQDFVKAVQAQLEDPKKFPMKTAYYRPVKSSNVEMMTMFGKDFKRGKADSRQNIDVLFQGPMNFKRKGMKDGIPVYTMTSNHTVIHGEKATGDYAPYYYVRPEQAKNQFGIKGARFFIVSKLTATKNRNASEV
jgi:hypothetical protein